jgi:hypothetical protein
MFLSVPHVRRGGLAFRSRLRVCIGVGNGSRRFTLHAHLFQFAIQGRATQTENGSRLGSISFGLPQDLRNVLLLVRLQGRA